MRAYLLVALLFCGSMAHAQAAPRGSDGLNMKAHSLFYTGINGEPILTSKYEKLVYGTPFFSDEWLKGIVVLPNGDVYKGIDFKIDLLEGTLLYRNEKGEERMARAAVKEVLLSEGGNDSIYRFVPAASLPFNAPKAGWYLWLHSGKAALYKHFGKQLSEEKRYGSATSEQRITTMPTYFIVANGIVTEVKKLKELPKALPDKEKELQAFIKNSAGSAPEDKRFADAVAYYNTLLP
jgi:hypothetical protein